MGALRFGEAALLLALLTLLAPPLGRWVARSMEGEGAFGDPVFRPVERLVFAACRIRPDEESGWRGYAAALLAFNLLGIVLLFLLQRFQDVLPMNPAALGPVRPDLALNTSVSFVTNTNWQSYAGETTLSAFVQMAGLTVQNFLSAATGLCVAVALCRGFARRESATVGNFWADVTRATVRILLPLSLLFSLLLLSQGVVQSFAPGRSFVTVEGAASVLPSGPVASQEAVKLVGTNGGGYFNANSSHPFENPTPLSNFLQEVAILLLPAALCFTFGRIVGDGRQGWALYAAMVLLLAVAVAGAVVAESRGTAAFPPGIDGSAGNLEGKEVRFGSASSALYAVVTTATSCGAVDAMHDSFSAIGGFVPLAMMTLGEVVFGGVGSGLYGILLFAVLAVFVAGLMVGRTPEYLGKKVEAREMTYVSVAVLVSPVVALCGAAVASATAAGRGAVLNPGAHGFTEILYAFTSAANNNGSAFAGLSTDGAFYNVGLAVAMLLGRFGVIVPVLAATGSMAAKKRLPATAGTFPTDGILFVGLLVGVVLVVGALTSFPALSLGPLAEHFSAGGAR